jgi:hypothetical protein
MGQGARQLRKTGDIYEMFRYAVLYIEQIKTRTYAMKPKSVGRNHGQTTHEAALQPAGTLSGSIILTLDGEIPVEHLLPGDRVVTRDSGMAVLRSVHRHQLRTRAVRIVAGSLGDTRPDRDVLLPEDQQILVRDWRAQALFGMRQFCVPVQALLDGEFIVSEGLQTMTLHELRFDDQHVIYADGLEIVAAMVRRAQAQAA